MDTKANDIPGVADAVREQTQVLFDILTAIKQGMNIKIKIDGNDPGFDFTRRGM
ncbi:hypothetical protein G3I15_58005 [Streptomyces sp. SID10244]|nr:hypothetical protein [Streptomyces sp. SID10244]